MEKKLEYVKLEERLDFAIDMLKRKFPTINEAVLCHEASEIARTLFIRSEIAYSGKKQ